MQLTVQIHLDGAWRDAALLELPEPGRGAEGPVRLAYLQAHAIEGIGRDDAFACSLNLPVELFRTHRCQRWFGFLEDIMPAGASRRFWVGFLGLNGLSTGEQDSRLLAAGTIAPVGNLRIKEAVPPEVAGSRLRERRFTLEEVVDRHVDFLEYAQQMGAASGGATGAGGEAPKLLLRRSDNNEVWIDTWQDEPERLDAHMLVKFPRGNRTQDDCDILRAEYHYYRELAALGVDTIETAGMQLIEGDRYPSLWLPRFDIAIQGGRIHRRGLESVYSALGERPGAFLRHGDVVRRLVALLERQHRVVERGERFDRSRFVSEWLRRDLLNVAFGNSDNHGRNIALLKGPEGVWLSPVYDFAPMKADPEGVLRTTTWGSPLEEGGEFDWQRICRSLDDMADPESLMTCLQRTAAGLVGLRERLSVRGVPARILDMPAVGLDSLEARLTRWGLV